MREDRIVIISGPTASRKTETALSLAKRHGLPIVNFDSLLFYRELNIATAKPTPEEMEGVDHYLMDFQSAKDPINAAQFSKLARGTIESLHKKGVIPILVGGSGFYLKGLLAGMGDTLPPSEKSIERSKVLYEKEGIDPFRKILEKQDPTNFHKLHPNDHYRIRRAVEFYWSRGRPFSSHEGEGNRLPSWRECHLYFCIEKEQHWKMIEARSKKIVEKGLVEEVRGLLRQGFTGREKPLQSIGPKEAFEYLAGTIEGHEQLIERLSISTRQLAKAQKTFFAHFTSKESFDPLKELSSIEKRFSNFTAN
ncbi:MAG: tRNA (adenosine(37)-N6)-dimethylallyltransferase MiaA [Bacteriovoracales bacterium]|nr:tRNA (adenosine(37)-N6)-dimethylallyltransferase MiaA [Bacteriovoracales bacterium]